MLQITSLLIASMLFLVIGIIAKDKTLIYGTVGTVATYILLVFILTM